MPDCLENTSILSDLLAREQFEPAVQSGAAHLNESAEHSYRCRYDLAVAYWGLGATAVGDKIWPLGTTSMSEASIVSPGSGTAATVHLNLGPSQEEVLSERMYHCIRNGRPPSEEDSRVYLKDMPEWSPRAQAPAYILASWLQAKRGEYEKAIGLTVTFTPFSARGRIDIVSSRLPLVWRNRLDAIRMICYGAVGALASAEECAAENRNHPVAEVRAGATQILRTRYLISESLRQNRVRKIATQLLQPRAGGSDSAEYGAFSMSALPSE